MREPPEWLPTDTGDKQGEIRLAVVVANDDYMTQARLHNTHRDATAMSRMLRALHFNVLFLHNATKVHTPLASA